LSAAILAWKASISRSIERSVTGLFLEATTMLNGVVNPGPITAEILS
jgi:hypothetical protein